MSILTQAASEPLSPIGIVLIIVFVGIIVMGFVSMFAQQKAYEKFSKELLAKSAIIERYGKAYVTEKGELLFDMGTGFKKWNLQEIGYIATYRGDFSIHDHDRKAMRGEYLTFANAKNPIQKKYTSFSVGYDTVKGYVAFVKKHGSHIQHISGGKVKE